MAPQAQRTLTAEPVSPRRKPRAGVLLPEKAARLSRKRGCREQVPAESGAPGDHPVVCHGKSTVHPHGGATHWLQSDAENLHSPGLGPRRGPGRGDTRRASVLLPRGRNRHGRDRQDYRRGRGLQGPHVRLPLFPLEWTAPPSRRHCSGRRLRNQYRRCTFSVHARIGRFRAKSTISERKARWLGGSHAEKPLVAERRRTRRISSRTSFPTALRKSRRTLVLADCQHGLRSRSLYPWHRQSHPIPMLHISSLHKAFGERVLFDSVSWQLQPGMRVGLCGPERRGQDDAGGGSTGLPLRRPKTAGRSRTRRAAQLRAGSACSASPPKPSAWRISKSVGTRPARATRCNRLPRGSPST